MTAVAAPPTVDTLPARLLELAERRGGDVALRRKHRGRWREWTWAEYAGRVARVAAGLRALGVGAGDRVAIHSENRPEWVIADLAIQGLGAQCVGVYPTSPEMEVEYLLGHSRSRVLIAEDEEQLDKALAVRERLPELTHLVVVDPRGVRLDGVPGLLTFADLERLGDVEGAEREYAASVARLDPEETAILVYTSGTTGPPKGAMISHANLVASARVFVEALGGEPDDEVLSYLPLCHIAERLISVVDAVWAGSVVNFGEGGPSFQQDLRDVQPTVFLGVPRVWEKMLAAVQIRMADASRLKRAVYRACLRQGRRIAPRRMTGRATPTDRLVLAVCEALVFRPLREKLGMVRVRVAVSGAAPIAPQVLEYLWAIGVPVREGYGQTENTAICTLTPAGDVRLGAVGVPLPGVELRIAPDGEILTRSTGVFQGYLNDSEATAATVDADGWLHTGDVGELDADGFLRITDRKKDIIITAGGKNVSPSEIENRLKVSPYIREAVVVGDRRKYLTALVGIEQDTVGDWATRRGLAYTTYADLAGKPEVRSLVQSVVTEVNRELAAVEHVKRFTLLDKELDHEDGELTATQKVKRRAIAERFADEIEAMYR
ncbi:long-chain acyl-CoA synthetase [Amycolatopsis arida]|uniref:Acyl-CoA synthetase n=1 Tax=Amycolatopsis arida TaxID=587909 RepID=A0A1I5TFK9_9PSEU|nr:AMP-binding protein [Amycolatopsis arida]TDX96112.1 long-chain acyl-CoA synthetase [Amycolatopsis arida]SFP81852.1 long-chain acyl-CoA synthetase [Amycolatopsis arida]